MSTPTRDELPPLPEAHAEAQYIRGGAEDVFTADQMREYASAALLSAHQAQAEPAGWRKFINDCAGTAGGMVNGSHLSILANRVLASARPSQAQEPTTPCQNAEHMGEHACQDRNQCWEPCCELGHSAEHARVAQPVSGAMDEREAFEKWAKAYGRIFIEKDAEDRYEYAFTQEAWVGWQARAAVELSRAKLADAKSEELRIHAKKCNWMNRALAAEAQQAPAVSDDAREKALNALLWFYRRAKPTYGRLPFAEEAIAALSQPAAAPASEQPKEPVHYCKECGVMEGHWHQSFCSQGRCLVEPAQPVERQELSDEEIERIDDEVMRQPQRRGYCVRFARAIIAADRGHG